MKNIYFKSLILFLTLIQSTLSAQQTESVYSNQFKRTPKNSILSYLYTQPGYELYKNELRFLGMDSRFLDFSFNGMDIRNPFNGEFVVSPIFEITNDVILGKQSPGSVDVRSIQSNDRLSIFSSYLLDSFYPSTQSKGLQSFIVAASGRNEDVIPLSFQIAYKRRYHEQPTYQNEPIYEFVNPVNLSALPVTYQQYNTNSGTENINEFIDVLYPSYKLGSENTVHDFMGHIKQQDSFLDLTYNFLGNFSDGRSDVTPFQIFAFDKRSAYEKFLFTHELTGLYKIGNTLFFELGITSTNYKYESFDPDFKNKTYRYGDPDFNPTLVLNQNGFIYNKVTPKVLYYYFSFNQPQSLISDYSKKGYDSKLYKFSSNWVVSDELKLNATFVMTEMVVRNITFKPLNLKAYQLRYVAANGVPEKESLSIARSMGINSYGYDFEGKETNDPGFRKKTPTIKMYDLGVSYKNDQFNVDADISLKQINLDVRNVKNEIGFDTYGYLTPESYEESKTESVLNFKFNGSYKLSENISFQGNISKRNILPTFDQMYQGEAFQSRVYGGGGSQLVGYGVSNVKSIEENYFSIGGNYCKDKKYSFSTSFFRLDRNNLAFLNTIQINENGYTRNVFLNDFTKSLTKNGFVGDFIINYRDFLRFYGNYTWVLNSNERMDQLYTNILTNDRPLSPSHADFPQYYFYNVSAQLLLNKNKEISEIFGEVSIIYEFQGHSGYPFTRTFSPGYPFPNEPMNASSTNPFYVMDLSVQSELEFSGLVGVVYLKVENLLNKKINHSVFTTSGGAGNDGYLSSPDGIWYSERYGPGFTDAYAQLINNNNSSFYFAPRTFIFGVSLEF